MSRIVLGLLLLCAFAPAGAQNQTIEIDHWQVSWPNTRPRDPAVAHDGRIWFVQTHTHPNRFVGFDPKAEKFFSSTAIPGGAGSMRHMIYDAKHQVIWFATDSNYLMRARLPD